MKAQQIILNTYGAPNETYESKYMELWQISEQFEWFGKVLNTGAGKNVYTTRIYINRDFKTVLVEAFKALECNGAYKEIKTYDGCFNKRAVRGYSEDKLLSLSLHSWGMAIDLNAAKEKLNQQNTNWTNKFINTMLDAGLYWGGSWKSRKDSMHFAMYNG